MSLKTQLKKRTPEHMDVSFCMDRPLAKQLSDALSEDLSKGGTWSGGKSQKVKELEKQVRDASVTIRVSSLSWSEYNELMNQHPPRDGKTEEFNSETFYAAAAKMTAVEVTAKSTMPIPDEDWDDFIDGLTDGEYERLASAVMQVNRNFATVGLAPLG